MAVGPLVQPHAARSLRDAACSLAASPRCDCGGRSRARHGEEPYDLIYQFSSIEKLAVPASVATRGAARDPPRDPCRGRAAVADRRAPAGPALPARVTRSRSSSSIMFAARARAEDARFAVPACSCASAACSATTWSTTMAFPQRTRSSSPTPCASSGFPRPAGRSENRRRILVLGRIAVRKGIEDVVAVATALLERGVDVRVRVVGGPSLWSDYTKLLEDLPAENAEYAGPVGASRDPGGARRKRPAAAGQQVRAVCADRRRGAGGGSARRRHQRGGSDRSAWTARSSSRFRRATCRRWPQRSSTMLERLRAEPTVMRSTARAEAERLFAPEVVCEQISAALERLVERAQSGNRHLTPAPALK